jgi:hypothetical protein
MAQCTNCTRELKEGEELRVVRVQLWKTKVGSKACKEPDLDETRRYCPACTKSVELNFWKE